MLRARDLRLASKERSLVNRETYREILAELQKGIRMANDNGAKELSYRIPPFVPGRPLFQASRAAKYVRKKLTLAGFQVNVESPHPEVQTVTVRWNAAEKRRVVARGPVRPRRHAERSPVAKPPESPTKEPTKELPITVEEATRRLQMLKAHLDL